jgi:hypothetical protein
MATADIVAPVFWNIDQHRRDYLTMRSGSSQRLPRGRYNGNQPQQQRTPQRNQMFDSNGPDVRVRGNAHQIFERYIGLARETAIGGDPITAENFYQHAEHYFRIASANRESAQQETVLRPITPANVLTHGTEHGLDEIDSERSQRGWGDDRPRFT